MVFSSIDSDLQILLLHNYEQFGKFFIFFILFAVCLIYKFFWKPYYEEMTAFISVGILRFLLDKLSLSVLVLSPLFIFFLSPEYSFWSFMTIIVEFLGVAAILFLVGFGVDIINLGVKVPLEKMGVNTRDPRAKLFLKKFNTNNTKLFK